MPKLKYQSLIDFIKQYPGVRISVDSYTWITSGIAGNDHYWTVWQRPYNAKKTRILYQGTDEAKAIWYAIGENGEQ